MSVLEKFLILFESDATDAKKDVDKLNKTLGKTEKGAKDATTATGKTSTQFLAMGTAALGAVGGVVALGAAVAGVISNAGRIDDLGKFADLIGENIEDVDAWGEAVVRSGGSVDGFRGSIESLTEKLTDAAVRGSNEITPFFNQLGVSIVDSNGKMKSTLDLLPELASSFEGLSKQKALGLGKKLGLDKGTIMLLQEGREGVDKLVARQKALGVTSDEAYEASKDFVDIIADMRQVTNYAAQSFIVNFLPAITWMIDKFNDASIWARSNKTLLYGFFIGLGVAAIPVLYSMAAAGWAAIAPLLVMAAPFLAIAAAAGVVGAAIALVVEDIMMFIQGNDSLIGDISKKWPIVGEIVKAVVDQIMGYVDTIKALASAMTDVFLNPGKALDAIMGKVAKVKSFLGFGDNEEIKIGQQVLATAGGAPLSSQTTNSIMNRSSSRSTSVQTGDIVIQTQATDGEGIASEAANSLNQQLRSTVDSFDDGVAF